MKRYYPWMVVLLLFSGLLLGLALIRPNRANAQAPQQYPILDKVATRIIAKYQNSTCDQLYMQKSQKAPLPPEEQKAVDFLHSDPQMRAAFIGKVAAPIANKLFDCGLIP